jgi:exonuclease VII small subunit
VSDDWSGLGWNPTPGHPHLATSLSNNLLHTAETLQTTYELLDSLSKESAWWSGEAATAFTEKVTDLPDYLRRAHESLRAAGGEIAKWSDTLHDLKVRAGHYEADAEEARGNADRAERDYETARSDPDLRLAGQMFTDKAQLDDAQARLDSANSRLENAGKTLDSARGRLQDLIDDAKKLESRHGERAQEYADAIRKYASEYAPEGGAWEKFKDWWNEHGGDLLTVAATVVGIAAIFCPVLAPIAIGLSLAAAAQHTYQYVRSGKDMWPPTSKNLSEWATLGGDLLGAVPGVGPAIDGTKAAIEGGRTAFEAARGAETLARTGATVSRAAKDGGEAFNWAAKSADPSNPLIARPVEWAAAKLGSSSAAGAMAADVTQAVATGALALPTAITLDPDYTDRWATPATNATVAGDGVMAGGLAVEPLQKIFAVARAL